MDSGYQDGTVLLEIDEVLIIHLNPQPITGKSTTLRMLHFEKDNRLMLMHADFLYAITKDVPIFTNTRPDDCTYGKRYVVPLGSNGKCKAFVLEGADQGKQIDDLNYLLDQYGTLFFANDGQEPEWIDGKLYIGNTEITDIQEFSKQNSYEKQVQDHADNTTVSKKIGNYLSIGGDFIKQGLTFVGTTIGTGIRKSSGLWKKLVGKNEKPVNVNPSTMRKIKATNTAAGTILTFTSTQISAAMKLGFDLAIQAKKEFLGSEKGQSLSSNKYFIHTMNVGKGVGHVIGGVYHGVEAAFVAVAKGSQEMTSSVLEFKYGEEVKEAFDEATGVVGNIYEIKKAPRDAFHKEMFDRTQNKREELTKSQLMAKDTAMKYCQAFNQQQGQQNSQPVSSQKPLLQNPKVEQVPQTTEVPKQRWNWGQINFSINQSLPKIN